ncbi:MAG: hypothetical protein M3421_06755 [Bacteroidota bacterium]|nr:hypothetical protein [Bacteroidota bacterium]
MKYWTNYNPYKFIMFIPLAIIAGLVYVIISSWSTINNTTLIALIFIIFMAITFLGYQISKDNHPLRGMRYERGEVEDIVQKIIMQRRGVMSDDEVINLRLKAKNIYNNTFRRAERTMQLKLLMDEYLKDKK